MNALLFLLILFGLLVLPFIPLVAELRASRDVAPLPIDEDLPIDASRLASLNAQHGYVSRIDVERAEFNGVVAAANIRVRRACRFRHLYGTPIVFGAPREAPEGDPAERQPVSMTRLLAGIEHRAAAPRYLVFGDLRLPAHAFVEADFVVDGSLYLGESCLVRGSVKANRVEIGPGATVRGAVFARHSARLEQDSAVEGVISVDGPLSVERAWIGRAENAVSVSASDISIQGGACVFGQLVAARSGRFEETSGAPAVLGASGLGERPCD